MEALDRKLSPVLTQLMTLPPGNDNHPDVVWLYSWLIEPERSVKDFIYILGPLQNCQIQVMTTKTINLFVSLTSASDDTDGDDVTDNSINDNIESSTPHNSIYVARVVSEALAVRCPVLEGQWETVVGQLLVLFKSYCYLKETIVMYGPASTIFSTWLIRVVTDSYLCPNSVLRFNMLYLYRILVKFYNGNYEEALVLLMLICSFLDRHADLNRVQIWNNLKSYLQQFSQFDLRIAESFRIHRDTRGSIRLHDFSHEYAIGLKTVSNPREVNILTVLLKCASEGCRIDYQVLYEECDEDRIKLHVGSIREASTRLFSILVSLNRAVQEPELISITAETTMDVLEALVVVMKLHLIPNPAFADDTRHFIRFLYIVCLSDLKISYSQLKEFTVGHIIGKTPIEQEIIRKYRGRIRKMRINSTEQIRERLKKDFTMIYDIVYNDEY